MTDDNKNQEVLMKKNKLIRLTIITLGVTILMAGSFLAYYRLSRIQGVKKHDTINASLKNVEKADQVIIYTQERGFKNEVLERVKKEVDQEQIYIEIAPIEEIETDFSSWDKVIILSTVQSSNPPENVLKVITQHKDDEKLQTYLTADSRRWSKQPADVDAYTGASTSSNVSKFSQQILDFIKLW